MNSAAKIFKLLPIFILLFWACQPEEESILNIDTEEQEIENFLLDAEEVYLTPSINGRIMEEINPCFNSMEVPLFIMRNEKVGKVSITNGVESLFVKYEVDPGFSLDQTMLVIIVEKEVKKYKRSFRSKYKKYVYPISHKSGTSEYVYEIPLKNLKNECFTIAAFAKLNNSTNERKYMKFAIAKLQNESNFIKSWMLGYCLTECVATSTCEVKCTIGFGIPTTSNIKKSVTFSELGIDDWPWGYAHEINIPQQSSLIPLPIKIGEINGDPDSGIIVGNANVIIEGETIYVSIMMDENYPVSKTSIYLSDEAPVSGIPCDYNYTKEYLNADGTVNPVNSELYELTDSDGKFWIVIYADVCGVTL